MIRLATGWLTVLVAADHLAEMLGEPYGTLILTFSIVAIEVMLISTVMLGGDAETVGRDTMFAVMMIAATCSCTGREKTTWFPT